jgi:hypothetical protein
MSRPRPKLSRRSRRCCGGSSRTSRSRSRRAPCCSSPLGAAPASQSSCSRSPPHCLARELTPHVPAAEVTHGADQPEGGLPDVLPPGDLAWAVAGLLAARDPAALLHRQLLVEVLLLAARRGAGEPLELCRRGPRARSAGAGLPQRRGAPAQRRHPRRPRGRQRARPGHPRRRRRVRRRRSPGVPQERQPRPADDQPRARRRARPGRQERHPGDPRERRARPLRRAPRRRPAGGVQPRRVRPHRPRLRGHDPQEPGRDGRPHLRAGRPDDEPQRLQRGLHPPPSPPLTSSPPAWRRRRRHWRALGCRCRAPG